MSVEVRFYHLTRAPLEAALPQVLSKALGRGMRAVVLARTAERVADLNALLWTYEPGSFLPHGSKEDGFAERQPIWLTDVSENPNAADLLILTDGAVHHEVDGFSICCEMIDGRDEQAVAAARERWRAHRAAGRELTYWQQGERGWERKA